MQETSIAISIIVPVYNSPKALRQCLSALQRSAGPSAEVIVVDDASTDDTGAVAAAMGVRVLRLTNNSGPGAARNYGARHARGDVLLFVDADVVVAPDVVGRVAEVLDKHADVAAVFGSYDNRPPAKGVVSQYRNLLHHFVHQDGNPEASTFWAGCGAIRRTVFEDIGGFDEKRFPRPSIEDIELGYRLRRAGYRILLDKGLQGTHLKKWTLGSVVWSDITCRAVPWSRLIIESKTAPDDLNLRGAQRLSVALVCLATALLPVAAVRLEGLAAVTVAVVAVVVLNRGLFTFFYQQRGLPFAAACVPLHLLYYLYGGLSYLGVWVGVRLRNATAGSVCATERK
jgi:GT2 family glycosyltransferase